jgi:ferredoxin
VATDKCTQCNECSFVCPHAAIRPQLTTAEEREHAPAGYHAELAKGSEASGLWFRIQVSPYDCTGCEMCAHACPQECLEMLPADDMVTNSRPPHTLVTNSMLGHTTDNTPLLLLVCFLSLPMTDVFSGVGWWED